MTAARAAQIDLKATFFYHCMTRCKRGSFLNGRDGPVERDFSHRKRWIIRRIKNLTDVFAIKVCAYAVMNNHYHLILHIDADQALTWSNLEIKTRWSKLFPRDAHRWEKNLVPHGKIEDQIMAWRERLCSISWFMRCLNEYIARLSNKEDGRKGRFWQSRFRSQALMEKNVLLDVIKDSLEGVSDMCENSALCLCPEEIKRYSPVKTYLPMRSGREERYGGFLTTINAFEKIS